jgi:uncharacterized protein
VSRKRSSRHPRNKRGRGPWILVGLVGLFVAFGAGYFWRSWEFEKMRPPAVPPLYEEKTSKEIPPSIKPKPSKKVSLPSPEELPKVAIVIDDLGYQRQLALKFVELDIPLTLAFLPQAPFAGEMARKATQNGKEILLHIPMEPKNYPEIDPGPGALLTAMTDREIGEILEKDFRLFPQAAGVNNHMGSRFTEDEEKMALLLKRIKGENLFFLDSLTTPDSVGLSLASRMGVKAIGRDIFLDNVSEDKSIRLQLDALIRLAQERGMAVGCGHPHPQTLQAIREKIPELREKVRLVPLSSLVEKKKR